MNKKPSKFSPEAWERAVRLVREQRSEQPPLWAAAVESIAAMIGCTPQTLPEMMQTIELAQYGFFVPFVFKPKRGKYSFSVRPDHKDKNRSAESVRVSDRVKFEAIVAAAQAASRHPDPF